MFSVPLVAPLPLLAIWRSQQSRRVEVKLDEEVMGRGVAVCEVGEIVEKRMEAVWLRMEDVVLLSEEIVLAVLEEREEAEEAKEKEKKKEKKLAVEKKMNKKEIHEKVKQEIKKKYSAGKDKIISMQERKILQLN
ncbi:uncharacterized protein MONOS_1703 [Monocercomonoides exilis]|uniref:uncharacterized protein n=1 Tax=Monocercomonoides exilis TaxID=2049356 RepID=UPI00355A5A0F|nr:hypothetical protein MONOS_1703 [Monocercomonoides exilis]|eukprot:MONOS_1703.1-p1 / transcript=MONOS_1703.1 / gene=MONOS_1703 / organism=Monocercomonoides_exilis_PA203 / gene_product=unspecified product / transcript_product=unspecified product / location=Mono_scaffold00031:146517-147020(+) / protein_length=135 / sequence_SO=supercontig / SO=protein_coding / is_pseudo=false